MQNHKRTTFNSQTNHNKQQYNNINKETSGGVCPTDTHTTTTGRKQSGFVVRFSRGGRNERAADEKRRENLRLKRRVFEPEITNYYAAEEKPVKSEACSGERRILSFKNTIPGK